MSVPYAVFDFDNTLTTQDSIVPYLLYCRKKGLCSWGHLLRCMFAYAGQRLDPSRVLHAKSVSLSFLKGKTTEQLDELAHDFFTDVMSHKLLTEGQKELRRLRNEGYRIMIVSASADVYMRAFKDLLGVDDLMCTRTITGADGRFTGEVESNCRGEEKVRRLREWLQERAGEQPVLSCGYGDSNGDVPMLRFLPKATLVDPSPSVRKKLPEAQVVNWHSKGV